MSAAIDRVGDEYPHGTVRGYDDGCKGGGCPAGAEHGLSCKRAKTLAAGDYRYQKLVRAGQEPWEIAMELGLVPEVHDAQAPRRARPTAIEDEDKDVVEDDNVVDTEQEEAPMEQIKQATPADVAKTVKPKRKTPAGPPQSEVRAWAHANGIEVNPRGSVRRDVVDAYLAAQAAGEPSSADQEVIDTDPLPDDWFTPAAVDPTYDAITAGLARTQDALALALRLWAAEHQRADNLAEQLVDTERTLADTRTVLDEAEASCRHWESRWVETQRQLNRLREQAETRPWYRRWAA